MRQFITILFLLIGQLCCANMASPIWEGTSGNLAFSSRNIDIIKERLFVTIDKEFKTASYVVEYYIITDTNGKQIPLLFYAKQYKDLFKVWVDEVEISVLNYPENFAPYEKSFNDIERVEIKWSDRKSDFCRYSDLKYFEIDLTKGVHKVRVEYTAFASIDKRDWTRVYSFDYSLSPAKNWRTFGELEITLIANSFGKQISTNLGMPISGKLDSIAIWKFDKLPSDYFQIIYKPELNWFSKILVTIHPIGLMIIFGLLLSYFHFISIKRFRKKEPHKICWILIVGSILIPFLILISYLLFEIIIGFTIGSDASGMTRYSILIIFFYPILMPIYFLIMWIADILIKKLALR